jgi:hypothetical protein
MTQQVYSGWDSVGESGVEIWLGYFLVKCDVKDSFLEEKLTGWAEKCRYELKCLSGQKGRYYLMKAELEKEMNLLP